jgi:hypothetical protein
VLRRLAPACLIVLGALTFAGAGAAFTCPQEPLEQRIEQADGAFVGRSTGFRQAGDDGGIPQRVYTFRVDQRVKGDIGATVDVRIPALAENGGQEIPPDVAAGVLAGDAGGAWVTTRCGITDPGALLATFDEPRGQSIRLVIGLVILAAVLAYSIRRLRRRNAAASTVI